MEVKKRSSMVKTMDYELWTTEIGLHTVTQVNTEVKKRRVPQYELRTMDFELWTLTKNDKFPLPVSSLFIMKKSNFICIKYIKKG